MPEEQEEAGPRTRAAVVNGFPEILSERPAFHVTGMSSGFHFLCSSRSCNPLFAITSQMNRLSVIYDAKPFPRLINVSRILRVKGRRRLVTHVKRRTSVRCREARVRSSKRGIHTWNIHVRRRATSLRHHEAYMYMGSRYRIQWSTRSEDARSRLRLSRT